MICYYASINVNPDGSIDICNLDSKIKNSWDQKIKISLSTR